MVEDAGWVIGEQGRGKTKDLMRRGEIRGRDRRRRVEGWALEWLWGENELVLSHCSGSLTVPRSQFLGAWPQGPKKSLRSLRNTAM